MNFRFNMKYYEKLTEQNLPKCTFKYLVHFPAPWFMTTFSLLLTTDTHSFFSWSLWGQDLNEENTLLPCEMPKTPSLEVLPHPIPCLCWVGFHHFPAENLWLCLEHFRGQSDSRSSGELPTVLHQWKILPFIWGHLNPSDQSITCIFGWLNNAFLLQQERHSPSAPLGSSVSMVQHKISPSMGFYISELSVCEQDADCSF